MADSSLGRVALLLLLLLLAVLAETSPLFKADQTQVSTFQAVSDVVDSLINSLGWNKDDIKISTIDTTDTKFGQTVIYEFDIQVGDRFLPVRLSEEINTWRYLDELPSGEEEEEDASVPATLDHDQGRAKANVERRQALTPVLAPFQLSGPVELWIQDADQLRLAVPHDVEAGVLRKILLADGAVVTVEGAREVSLEHPLQLPLSLFKDSKESGIALSLLELADRLRYASVTEQKPLLSLRIVGATSLIASFPKQDSDSTSNKLKVKRLAPGAVELISSKQGYTLTESSDSLPVVRRSEPWLWPLPSLMGSDSKLVNLEKLLAASLGAKAYKKGSFKLLKAKALAATFVQVEFQLERKLHNDSFPVELWPDWRTKPSVERLYFELTAKVEQAGLLPVQIRQLQPFTSVESHTWRELTGNVTFTKIPQIWLPSNSMTLDPSWEGIVD